MTRFSQVVVNKKASTVEVGAGLLWDDVYQALDGTGLNVLGGRVSGVGVAGFTLGGGEQSSGSTVFWLTDRHEKRLFLEDEPVWTHD
jgi:FAD/FMN-containing dehydrogenase